MNRAILDRRGIARLRALTHAARNETMERGDDTASAGCTSILYRVCYDPPPMNTPSSEGGRDERSRGPVPRGIDPIQCSSAQEYTEALPRSYFELTHPRNGCSSGGITTQANF